MSSTALTLLKKDHSLFKKLCQQLEDLDLEQVSERKEVFMHLKSELEIHSKLEEALLYPQLKSLDKTHKQILESTEEHHLVEKLLIDLSTMPMNTEEWNAKMTVLKENLLHHIREEEEELFPKAEKLLPRDLLLALAKQIPAQREKLLNSVLVMS